MGNVSRLIKSIIDSFRILIVAVVLIWAAFQIINSLIGQLPLWIQIIIGGLFVIFVYFVKDKTKLFMST